MNRTRTDRSCVNIGPQIIPLINRTMIDISCVNIGPQILPSINRTRTDRSCVSTGPFTPRSQGMYSPFYESGDGLLPFSKGYCSFEKHPWCDHTSWLGTKQQLTTFRCKTWSYDECTPVHIEWLSHFVDNTGLHTCQQPLKVRSPSSDSCFVKSENHNSWLQNNSFLCFILYHLVYNDLHCLQVIFNKSLHFF